MISAYIKFEERAQRDAMAAQIRAANEAMEARRRESQRREHADQKRHRDDELKQYALWCRRAKTGQSTNVIVSETFDALRDCVQADHGIRRAHDWLHCGECGSPRDFGV